MERCEKKEASFLVSSTLLFRSSSLPRERETPTHTAMEAASARINLGDLTAGLANAAAAVERWADGAASDAAAARSAHAKKMAELEGEEIGAVFVALGTEGRVVRARRPGRGRGSERRPRSSGEAGDGSNCRRGDRIARSFVFFARTLSRPPLSSPTPPTLCPIPSPAKRKDTAARLEAAHAAVEALQQRALCRFSLLSASCFLRPRSPHVSFPSSLTPARPRRGGRPGSPAPGGAGSRDGGAGRPARESGGGRGERRKREGERGDGKQRMDGWLFSQTHSHKPSPLVSFFLGRPRIRNRRLRGTRSQNLRHRPRPRSAVRRDARGPLLLPRPPRPRHRARPRLPRPTR